MNPILRIFLFLLLLYNLKPASVSAQCTTANLNWDNLDFLITSGDYSGFVTTAMAQTQAFAIGKNRIVITHGYSSANSLGENTTNTGSAGSYGSGADIQFINNGTITFTFETTVQNVKFSMYDIDYNQKVAFGALNGATPLNIVVAKISGTVLTVTGSGTTAPSVVAAATTAVSNTSTNGTINVDVSGPVTSITLTITQTGTKSNGPPSGQEDGSFWISDIEACLTGSGFPTNYFVAMQPFTGQPTYVIATSNSNIVSLVNVATGEAKEIFRDASAAVYINGLGYDHFNNYLYYVEDGTSNPAINKAVKRYDFDSETITTIIADITTLGIPTFDRGVESAGCAFYDDALYFGIEGNGGSGGRESIIWRIDFDGSGNPLKIAQIYSSSSSAHDWGDFAMADGIAYDFNSVGVYTHYDLQTGQVLNTYAATSPSPRQTGITWNDQLYWLYDEIALYNNGTLGASTPITGVTPSDWVGICRDATGYRPKADFGDAPSSYDPDPLSPALHEKDSTLRLGATWDQEFNKTSSLATADGPDEDGIPYVPLFFSPAGGSYASEVDVYNNTGSNATLIAWLDFNGNGLFDASEATTPITVPSSTSLQNFYLFWPSAPSSLTVGSYTYLRIRFTSAVNGMTASNATGYYDDGEVEDYTVPVDNYPLPLQLLSFNAQKLNNNHVALTWKMVDETFNTKYELQRRGNGQTWQVIDQRTASQNRSEATYKYTDKEPLANTTYYRLQFLQPGGAVGYSVIQKINFAKSVILRVIPNPATDNVVLDVFLDEGMEAYLQVTNSGGKKVHGQTLNLKKGANAINISFVKPLSNGIYMMQLITRSENFMEQLLIKK